MREKLIKVLDVIGSCNAKYCCDCEFAEDIEGCVRRQKEIIADHLIANGVTIPVRCKDCKHYNTKGCAEGFGWCEAWDNGRCDDHFCNFGERKAYDQTTSRDHSGIR